ncbi:MAG: restriction endonuclease subunit S [Sulfuricella sp.]|jgi:type I restriction enzyme S subunit
MSDRTTVQAVTIGALTFESKVRADAISEEGLRVYGVDRTDGLTPDAKYTSKNLGRYKVLHPGMFAYNPMRLNIGSIAYCTDKHVVGLVSPDYVVFGCKPGILDPDFFSYAIKGPEWRQWTTAAGVGSVRVRIYFRELAKMPITMPPFSEQKVIAHILGTLDDKIELNRRMNATLEAMARALFQSWFVDFDPVRAKLDGLKPVGLDADTAALFPIHFQESPLGHIPQGWEVCPLANKIELLSGGTPKTTEPDYWDGDIPWFSVKDAPTETDVWVIHTEKSVTKLGISNSAAQIFPEKTTIITARGTVGKLALTGTPMAMNQSCYGVRGITGYGDYFTYYSLRAATAQLQQRTHGTVFDTITRQTFETLDCIFPPPKLTVAFDIAVEPILEQIRANLHQSRTLATIRDALLPRLLSGELRVVVGAEEESVVA